MSAIVVESAGEWTAANNTITMPAGSNRILIVSWESSSAQTITGMTYGTVAMTPLFDQQAISTEINYRAFYMLEADIALASTSLIQTQGTSSGGGCFGICSNAPQEEPAIAITEVTSGSGNGPHTVTFPESTIGNGFNFPTDGAWFGFQITRSTGDTTGGATYTNVTQTWGQDNTTGSPDVCYYAAPANVSNGSTQDVTVVNLAGATALMHVGVGAQVPSFSTKTIRRTGRRLFAI